MADEPIDKETAIGSRRILRAHLKGADILNDDQVLVHINNVIEFLESLPLDDPDTKHDPANIITRSRFTKWLLENPTLLSHDQLILVTQLMAQHLKKWESQPIINIDFDKNEIAQLLLTYEFQYQEAGGLLQDFDLVLMLNAMAQTASSILEFSHAELLLEQSFGAKKIFETYYTDLERDHKILLLGYIQQPADLKRRKFFEFYKPTQGQELYQETLPKHRLILCQFVEKNSIYLSEDQAKRNRQSLEVLIAKVEESDAIETEEEAKTEFDIGVDLSIMKLQIDHYAGFKNIMRLAMKNLMDNLRTNGTLEPREVFRLCEYIIMFNLLPAVEAITESKKYINDRKASVRFILNNFRSLLTEDQAKQHFELWGKITSTGVNTLIFDHKDQNVLGPQTAPVQNL